MSDWKNWVIDASMSDDGFGGFCFCPVDGEGNPETDPIVTGMNIYSDVPPHNGKLVAIVHPDGQAAVEDWCLRNKDGLQRLDAKLAERNAMRSENQNNVR